MGCARQFGRGAKAGSRGARFSFSSTWAREPSKRRRLCSCGIDSGPSALQIIDPQIIQLCGHQDFVVSRENEGSPSGLPSRNVFVSKVKDAHELAPPTGRAAFTWAQVLLRLSSFSDGIILRELAPTVHFCSAAASAPMARKILLAALSCSRRIQRLGELHRIESRQNISSSSGGEFVRFTLGGDASVVAIFGRFFYPKLISAL